MTPASQMPPSDESGVSSGLPRPFIPGRVSARAPMPEPRSGIPRPFRMGASAEVEVHAVAAVDAEVVPNAEIDADDAMTPPGSVAEEGAFIRPVEDPESQSSSTAPGEDHGLATEAAFPPPVSWDPLVDVAWHATPEADGVDIEARPSLFEGIISHTPPIAEADSELITPTVAGDTGPEGSTKEDDFASKLEALAAAIRRGKVQDLLAENPQDALTALVAGYYMGTVGHRGGAVS